MRSRCEPMASQREAIYLGLCSVLGFKERNFIWEKWENSHPGILPEEKVGDATRLDCLDFSGSSHRIRIR